jgi:hypothetical protein
VLGEIDHATKKTGSKADAAVRVGRFCFKGKFKDGYSSREAEANEKANERGSNKRRYRSHGCDALNLPQLGG